MQIYLTQLSGLLNSLDPEYLGGKKTTDREIKQDIYSKQHYILLIFVNTQFSLRAAMY